jgi:SSS family solute:Na+ symporter
MHILDWIILAAYLAGIVTMSVVLGRQQRSADDYFLAGRRMRAWPIALSIMATQVSAVSLIGAPAFVALKTGGGMRWLQYELAVPLAMIVLIAIFVPRLRPLPITTLYDYLQKRFGKRARWALSLVFLISRGLSTAVALYAASVVLSVCLGLSLGWTLIILSSITVAYTTIGGIEADIYSDIAQMFVLAGGTILALIIAITRVEESAGLSAAWQMIDAERLRVMDFASFGVTDGQTFSFWPMMLGGFFLYLSYYGCDQSQAQRLLTSVNEQESARGLFLNGLLRFPFTLLYCSFGLLLLIFLNEHPEFAARVPADKPDYLVPMFVLEYFPTGLVGLVMAAIFAAAMSSFDSAFNSMSAVTVRNLLGRHRQDTDPSSNVNAEVTKTAGEITVAESRVWTVIWGVFCTILGYLMSRSQVTVIELINMVGSAFYGPTLAVFILGLLSRRASEIGVLAGLITGVATNILLWLFAPSVSWLWWNVTGFLVAVMIGSFVGKSQAEQVSAERPGTIRFPRRWTLGLLAAAGVMFLICLLLDRTLMTLWR